MGVMGTVKETAYGHVKHASFHTRLFQEPSWHYNKVSSDDDDDLIQQNGGMVADDYAAADTSSAALIEESFCYDDESSQVPDLIEQRPPVDLLDQDASTDLLDAAPAPMPLDR